MRFMPFPLKNQRQICYNRKDKGGFFMFCTKCGTQVPDGMHFCTNCGKQLVFPEPPPDGSIPMNLQKSTATQVQPQPIPQPIPQPAQPKKQLPFFLIPVVVVVLIAIIAVLAAYIILNPKDTAADDAAQDAPVSSVQQVQPVQPDTIPNDTKNAAEPEPEPVAPEPVQPAPAASIPAAVPAPEPETPVYPTVTMADIADVSASSSLSEYDMVHTPWRAVDNDASTAWVEGADSYGVGESISLTLNDTVTVNGFTIMAGYHKNRDLYNKNSRPAALTVTAADGTSESFQLDDVMSAQTFQFSKPMQTDHIKFTIQDIYPGNKYTDTVISEISLF